MKIFIAFFRPAGYILNMSNTLTGNERTLLHNLFMVKMADGRFYVAARTNHQTKLLQSLEQKGFLKKENFSLARWTRIN
jgi:hypothetical protein